MKLKYYNDPPGGPLSEDSLQRLWEGWLDIKEGRHSALTLDDLRRLDDQDLESAYGPRSTGLTTVIYVSCLGVGEPRIKVGDSTVSIENEPRVLEGSIPQEIFEGVSRWVVLNRDVLLGVWTGDLDLDSMELAERLRRLE